jgi:hypothetical protein
LLARRYHCLPTALLDITPEEYDMIVLIANAGEK